MSARSRLGRGARRRYVARNIQPNRYPSYVSYRPKRSLVPRTMGPFSVTESKYFTSGINETAIAESTDWTGTELDPGTLATLCVPQEGSDLDNRIGRKIAVYKIAIRGTLKLVPQKDQPDILTSDAIRLILYIDQQTNGIQAQGEEVMASPFATSVESAFCSFQNLSNLGRFRILRDKIYRASTMTAGTDGTNTQTIGSASVPFKMTYRFKKPIIIRFNATSGGTIGDIVDNSFHLIGQKSGGDFGHSIVYQCRTYYKDN